MDFDYHVPGYFGLAIPARRHKARGRGQLGGRHGDVVQPSLNQLRAANKAKTKKHFRARWSVPAAPEHATSFSFPTPASCNTSQPIPNALFTPAPSFSASASGRFWRNGLGSVDEEAAEIGAAAGIDMFGSMLEHRDHTEESCSDDDPYGFDLDADAEEQAGPRGAEDAHAQHLKKLEDQAAYICQLEETNLKLQERIYILEQNIQEMAKEHGSRHFAEPDSSGVSEGPVPPASD